MNTEIKELEAELEAAKADAALAERLATAPARIERITAIMKRVLTMQEKAEANRKEAGDIPTTALARSQRRVLLRSSRARRTGQGGACDSTPALPTRLHQFRIGAGFLRPRAGQ